MRITRVFSASPVGGQQHMELSAQAGQHLARVLRMRAGGELVLFDGRGGEYRARISAVSGDRVSVEIRGFDPVERESPLRVTLLQGVSRGERMDWTIQKATELGVQRIIPVANTRSVVKLKGERAERRQAHWQAVAAGACEQSGRNRLPEIAEVCSLEQACQQVLSLPGKLMLAADGAMAPALLDPAPHDACCLAVGPEGGHTPAERALLLDHGFKPLRLGPRVMRTETAGLAALAVLQARWGDF